MTQQNRATYLPGWLVPLRDCCARKAVRRSPLSPHTWGLFVVATCLYSSESRRWHLEMSHPVSEKTLWALAQQLAREGGKKRCCRPGKLEALVLLSQKLARTSVNLQDRPCVTGTCNFRGSGRNKTPTAPDEEDATGKEWLLRKLKWKETQPKGSVSRRTQELRTPIILGSHRTGKVNCFCTPKADELLSKGHLGSSVS